MRWPRLLTLSKVLSGCDKTPNTCEALPDILAAGGLPAVTLNHPSVPLGKLDMRLKQWGLK